MSMIFSLAIMQGISQKNVQQQDRNLQQVGAGMIIVGAGIGGENPEMGAATGFFGGTVLWFVADTAPIWGAMGPVGWVIGGGMAL